MSTPTRIAVIPLLIIAAGYCMGCGSGSGTGTDVAAPADLNSQQQTDHAGHDLVAQAQSQDCMDLLTCIMAANPGGLAAAQMMYGPSASCWTSVDNAAACTAACQDALAMQKSTHPMECGGDTSGTFVGKALVEQLFDGHPNVLINFFHAGDVQAKPTLTVAECEVSCSGTYMDDPNLPCGSLTPTQIVGVGNGPITVDIQPTMGDLATYTYDFVGNGYSTGDAPPTPFFAAGSTITVTTSGDTSAGGDPDALRGMVVAPDPIGLTAPMPDTPFDPTMAAGVDVAWKAATGTPASTVVIEVAATFAQAGSLLVARSSTATCTVPDNGAYTVPAAVTKYLGPGAMESYFQCGGPNKDRCLSLTAKRQIEADAPGGQTQFSVVGSTASPTIFLVVPMMMMGMP